MLWDLDLPADLERLKSAVLKSCSSMIARYRRHDSGITNKMAAHMRVAICGGRSARDAHGFGLSTRVQS